MRVVFMITQFDTGGAQNALCQRLEILRTRGFECEVLVLTGEGGFMLEVARKSASAVHLLHLELQSSVWGRVAEIRRMLGRLQPQAVCSMLIWDHTYGNAAALLAGVPLIVMEL